MLGCVAYKDIEVKRAYGRAYMRRKLAGLSVTERQERCAKTKAWRAANPDKCKTYQVENKEAIRQTNKRWRHAHPGIDSFYVRKSRLKKKYGLTVASLNQLLASQNHACLICKDPVGFGRPGSAAVDHDHQTGKVRGILCGRCNTGLGQFKEDPIRMTAAITYLATHRG